MNAKLLKAIVSWAIVAWICKIFLSSLPYKFSQHPDTQHIFGTIGQWMSDTIAPALGNLFTSFGAYAVGVAELITSLVLLLPAVLWLLRKISGGPAFTGRPGWHALGGLMASAIMLGAAFFHLFTPLGIEVLHEGKSDGGSLFYAAVSILVLGIVLFVINRTGRQVADVTDH